MFRKSLLILLFISLTLGFTIKAQVTTASQSAEPANTTASEKKEDLPIIDYNVSPKKYEIADIQVTGMTNSTYEDYVVIGFSGLSVGQTVEIPGTDITKAVKAFWRIGLFSDVKILATKTEGGKVWLEINLTDRPRISRIDYSGMKKGERQDIELRIGVVKGNQITPNQIDRAKVIIKKYYEDKGFKNAEIKVTTEDDLSQANYAILKIDVDKKEKIKVNNVVIDGNIEVSDATLEKSMKKTRHKHTLRAKIRNFLRSTNFIPESYEEDKINLISKYNELGYRDAEILWDTVYNHSAKKVNVEMKVNEGTKYHIRKVTWIGNTLYPEVALQDELQLGAGDVYNQKKLMERLSSDENAITNNFYSNHGYIFCQIDPVEVNIENDSIDLEIRIAEGPQASIRKVGISGNDRLYEDVIRRELRTKPGQLFSRENLIRSLREIAQMGHFNPENMNPDVQPDIEAGVVDLNYKLESKANDQVEFSAGWGQTGVIGRLSLKFTNFSLKNLFNRGSYKGFLPQGEGQTLILSAQTNATYYQSYSLSFMDPWFGGKRPNMLSVGAFYSRQTDVNSNYYNSSSLYTGYYSGYDNSYYNQALDPNKTFETFGFSVAYGKRLTWPDDYFQFQAELSYQIYKMRDWDYFLVRNGSANNLSLNFTLSRNSVYNPIFPTFGSQFSMSLRLTPPYSLFDGKDYASIGRDEYGYETTKKFRWIEYHKWKFQSKTYTPLTGGELGSSKRTLVLMTRAEFGLVGYYNKNKKSPFETFYVGGDGMSGYYSNYATETIALRGYENGSLGTSASAYSRLGMELRYPLILEPSSTIYILGFAEGGNAWNSIQKFNLFDLKRSAGFGVRIMLPMIGLMGIDWAYGFDKTRDNYGNSTRNNGGGQFHFIIGQEF